MRTERGTLSFQAREIPHPRWRGVSGQDAPIGMKLSHRDKTVLRQLFETVENFNAVLGEVRDDAVDHKYLGRVIEDVANHAQAIERELDEFAREWRYE